MNLPTDKKYEKIRLTYIDVVKAIAMISVVFFHACSTNVNIFITPNAFWIRFTSAYAMPVFFFINGFLYKNDNPERPIPLIIKKVKSYYLPFVIYNLFYVLAHNIFVVLHMVDENYGNGYYDSKTFCKHIILAVTGHRELFAGALWFLGSILIISVIFVGTEFIIAKIFRGKYRLIILGIIAVACLVLGNSGYITDRMKIATSLENTIYFYFGILYKAKGLNEFFTKKKNIYVIVGVLLNFVVSYNNQYPIVPITNVRLYILLSYINAFAGIIAVMMIAQNKVIMGSKLLNVVGKNTMDIMALHFMIFKVVSILIIMVNGLSILRLPEYPVLTDVNGCWWILYVLVGVTVPTLFGVLRHRVIDIVKGKFKRS